jgi:immunoglobulin-like protein involved in spore germination/sporulation and spore germination protein
VNDDQMSTLLHDAVETIEPTDRLGAIREQTRRPSRTRWYVAGGAVLAAAAVVTGIAVAVQPSSDPGPSPSTQPTASDTGSPGTHAVATYYVGDSPAGDRLFREFHQTKSSDTLASALRALTAGPVDPDYRTAWPDAAFRGGWIDYEGGLATVLLNDRSLHDRPAGMTAAQARLAIQQVVYTVQAAAQQRIPVRFEVEGQPIDQVYGLPTSEPLTNAPELDVLALVSISNPIEGRTVEGSFSADGVASSFEGSVPWRLLDPAGEVVLNGMGQGSMMEDHLTPWETGPIDVSGLPPGTYTFAASTDDPTGGTEGPGPTTDTRTVVIR